LITTDRSRQFESGLARSISGLTSLAFRDYRASAQSGVSVAKSNMAGQLNAGAVPEAALEILREHQGAYDSDDRGQPYAIRAELERALKVEEDKESDLRKFGSTIAAAFHRLFESYLRSSSVQLRPGLKWEAVGRSHRWKLSVGAEGVSAAIGDKVLLVVHVVPFENVYVASQEGGGWAVFLIRNEIEAFVIDDILGLGSLEWLQFDSR
jgi:hypothetical protein